MKGLWAWPVLLRVAIANSRHFNVYEDLHANPQYEIIFNKEVVTEARAETLLKSYPRSPRHSNEIEPQPTDIPSIHRPHDQQEHILDDEPRPSKDVAGYEALILKGERYLCSLPIIPEDEIKAAANTTKEDEEKELARATEQGWQLLKGMEGSCIYFVSGWWSYSFCFNDGVKQFHQLPPGRNVPAYPPVEDTNVGSYILGRFDGAKSKSQKKSLGDMDDEEDDERPVKSKTAETDLALPEMKARGESRYLVQQLQGGTPCDLTGKDRRIEVQFHCEATNTDRISLIKETATCQYLMMVSTPRLCNDMAFLPPQQKAPHAISCSKILPTGTEQPAYLALQDEENAERRMDDQLEDLMTRVIGDLSVGQQIVLTADDVDAIAAGMQKKVFVGGIEVGGHNIVPPGKKIESSAVVGGGKELFVATIARSDGYVASDEELKHHMKDKKQVEGVKKEMERIAKGKSWKLDVVDTARGRELRGIIDTDGGDDDKQKSKGIDSDGNSEVAGYGDGEAEGEVDDHTEDDGTEETYKDEL